MSIKMAIEKNQVVVLDYRLQNGSVDGDLIEETFGTEPLKFIFGIGQMIPAFEVNLEASQEGDEFAFLIKAAEGYGEYEEEALLQVPISQFANSEGEVNTESLKPGAPINMQDQEGRSYQGIIKSHNTETVTVDFNHPMAGTDLYFSGKIKMVRDATESELDHGHPHE